MEPHVRNLITREDLLEAIAALDAHEPHEFGESTLYDVLHDGRRYPPKAIVGLAARRTLGRTLRPNEFHSGGDRWAFRLLRENGFEITPKNDVKSLARLPSVAPQRIWIEYTKSTYQHGGPGWEFGTCLWSPSRNRKGVDWYVPMREVKAGDLILHINDARWEGWSYAAGEFRQLQQSPPNPGNWAERPSYYRIDLRDYRPFPTPISLSEFVAQNHNAIYAELLADQPKRYPFMVHRGEDVRYAQGAYLSRCTDKLYRLVLNATFGESTTNLDSPRYWAISLGEGGRLWDACQEQGIIAIGWDEYELGDLRNYPDRDSIQKNLSERRTTPSPTLANNALCLFQFAHDMQIGDFVVAKAGRKRLLGLGTVTSDYFLDKARDEYQHVRQVKWLKARPVELPERFSLPTETLAELSAYPELISFVREQVVETPGAAPARSLEAFSIDQALEQLFMPRVQLEKIIEGLQRKRNIILQGPPWVGKTFAARQIAYAFMEAIDPLRIEMVQFHQSYAYEDFVQGWRPAAEGGFRLKNGVFVEFCNRARIDPERKYVFIIDEINRGNLSKVFGELMLLIEADKRGAKHAIPLTYSESDGERFSVPENVYLIGLMNTADRSLALVDYALRRRFLFFTLRPALESDGLRQLIEQAGASGELVNKVRQRITALNARIAADPDLGEGFLIGHSFFCPAAHDADIGPAWYYRIIDTEIGPLLREYWFDKKADEVDAIISELKDGI